MLRLCYYAWEVAEVAKANRVDWFIGKEMFTANLTNGRNDNKGADTPYAILSPEWNALGLAEQVKQEAEFHEMIGTGRGGKFKELSDARNAGDTDRFYQIVIAFDKAWMAEHGEEDFSDRIITPEDIEEQKKAEAEAWEEFRKEQAEGENVGDPAEEGEEIPDSPSDGPEDEPEGGETEEPVE